jgi:hypothetical protein
MRRTLTLAGCTALLALIAASAASATVTYDPATQTGFIGRGDVIAAAGKGALIADPVVLFTTTAHYTLTCTWPDQVQRTATLERSTFVLFRAKTRYAGGSGTITGYSFTASNIFDGGASPPVPDQAICWALLGRADDGSAVDLQYQDASLVDAFTYFGPSAVQLPFVTP